MYDIYVTIQLKANIVHEKIVDSNNKILNKFINRKTTILVHIVWKLFFFKFHVYSLSTYFQSRLFPHAPVFEVLYVILNKRYLVGVPRFLRVMLLLLHIVQTVVNKIKLGCTVEAIKYAHAFAVV